MYFSLSFLGEGLEGEGLEGEGLEGEALEGEGIEIIFVSASMNETMHYRIYRNLLYTKLYFIC